MPIRRPWLSRTGAIGPSAQAARQSSISAELRTPDSTQCTPSMDRQKRSAMLGSDSQHVSNSLAARSLACDDASKPGGSHCALFVRARLSNAERVRTPTPAVLASGTTLSRMR
jgi:hypothetical protein